MQNVTQMGVSVVASNQVDHAPVVLIHNYLAKENVFEKIDDLLPVRNVPGKMEKYRNSDTLAKLLTLHLMGYTKMAHMDHIDPNFTSPYFRHGVSYHTVKERILELQEQPEAQFTWKTNKTENTRERVSHILYTMPELNERLLQLVIFLKLIDKGTPLILDADVTCINSQSKDAGFHYQKKMGFAPLVITCGGVILYAEMRKGNIHPSLFVAEAVERLTKRLRELGFTVGTVRLDSAGYRKKNVQLFQHLNLKFAIRAIKTNKKLQNMKNQTTVYIQGRKITYAETKKKFGNTLVRYIYNNANISRRTVAIITNDFEIDPLVLIKLYRDRGTEEQTMSLLKEFGWTPLIFHKIEHNAPYLIYSAMSMLLFKYVAKRYSQILPANFLKANGRLLTFRNKILNAKGSIINNQLVLSDPRKEMMYKLLAAA